MQLRSQGPGRALASGAYSVANCGRTAVRFTKRPLPWSRVGSEGAIHRAVGHLSPQGQTPNGHLTLAHPPTHRACPRDMVARGHLAPRPATQEATCNGARASSRAFQQTMGRVCSDVMVKHQPVRETLALISATKRRYRRRMSRFAHVSHPRPRQPGGAAGWHDRTRGRPAGHAPTTKKHRFSSKSR